MLNINLFKSFPVLNQYPALISSLIISSIFILRFIMGGFDPSYFIVASQNFVEKEYLTQDIMIRDKGYDGQFFYRYALNPFSKDIHYNEFHQGNHGIKVDKLKYRRARVLYPLTAWALALGYQPFVPYTLIFVNIFAFLLIIKISTQLVNRNKAPPYYAYFPLLISGLYLGVARDLSDTMTCAMLALSYLLFVQKKTGWFLVASTLALFSRESSAFYLFIPYILLFIERFHTPSLAGRIKGILPLFLPWLCFLLWSLFLSSLYPEQQGQSLLAGIQKHFGIPFRGMYDALTNINEAYSLLYVIVRRLIYILWSLMLFGLCFREISKNKETIKKGWMYWNLWASLAFCLSYTYFIYIDPWSFVRVLAPAHLFCFFFLIENKSRLPWWFSTYSLFVLVFTLEMILLRV